MNVLWQIGWARLLKELNDNVTFIHGCATKGLKKMRGTVVEESRIRAAVVVYVTA
jgi:hypothetical protein